MTASASRPDLRATAIECRGCTESESSQCRRFGLIKANSDPDFPWYIVGSAQRSPIGCVDEAWDDDSPSAAVHSTRTFASRSLAPRRGLRVHAQRPAQGRVARLGEALAERLSYAIRCH